MPYFVHFWYTILVFVYSLHLLDISIVRGYKHKFQSSSSKFKDNHIIIGCTHF